ncbi:Protein of unknown function [Micromonospora lupini str. Lupac 08]|uniref:Uncharacterized protein n=1 Tax=Micromonospora lupini str. Lupac 08 TaxID=1150864 RepID=I0L5M7_9ACTN|nr:Protein of unknown function [Micromonospora lupini str. Lupac 08]
MAGRSPGAADADPAAPVVPVIIARTNVGSASLRSLFPLVREDTRLLSIAPLWSCLIVRDPLMGALPHLSPRRLIEGLRGVTDRRCT